MLKTTLLRRVSRAIQPGPPGTPSGARRSWLAGAAAVVLIAVAIGLYLARSPHSAPASRYGGLPSWLPTPAIPVGRIAQASAAHPWLAIEGDTVRVRLTHGQTQATAVGPAVPEEGAFPVPATTGCTFTVTLADISGTVPISPAAFTIRDELGRLHSPQVTAQGGGPVPSDANPGHTVTLTIKSVLPTGNGQLLWAPQGGKPIVSWDFDVEID